MGQTKNWYALGSGEASTLSPDRIGLLEGALRQECEARDRYWECGAARALVGDWDRLQWTVSLNDLYAAGLPSLPVYAFALALIRALEAQ
ncbi:hypothetical protein [Deinococcus multiflagellatus]|uniref:hypothetical protein n=1 Tax=Deinococcus multiflagellatus TaxID=1656887 RepID=UPI001CCC7081|nr:hypothetical protein [Deinococcus multiflagellatus]MBZ9715359.1 hypothetical protein [Deinococcus multiflagellatus]